VGIKVPPPRPIKPLSLRSNTISSNAPSENPTPEATSKSAPRNSETNNPLPDENKEKNRPDPPPRNYSYLSSARAKASQAYNAMPAVSSYIPHTSSAADLPSLSSSTQSLSLAPALPRRGLTATAASYAASASNRLSSYRSRNADSSSTKRPSSSDSELPSRATTPPVNKKLELWRRRWVRAKEVLEKEGVVVMSWRKGEDVADEAVRVVERNLREMGVEGYGEGGKGKTGVGGGEAKVKDL